MKKAKKITLSVIAIIIVAIIAFAVKIVLDVRDTANKIQTTDETTAVNEKNLSEQEPFSVLLLGVDERDGDKGRSDTMIILTVNEQLGSTQMVSIPRDTYVDIIGKDKKDKINHAYAFGGMDRAKATVENLLGINIDVVSKVNMEGFQNLIDTVGPIQVDNGLAFSYGGNDFAKGKIELDGKEAMNYVQMRKEDPDGDFGRQTRQRNVIQGSIKELMKPKNIVHYDDIFDIAADNMLINLSFSELVDIGKNYKTSLSNIEQLSLNGGSSMMQDGIYYYNLDQTELETVRKALQAHLK